MIEKEKSPAHVGNRTYILRGTRLVLHPCATTSAHLKVRYYSQFWTKYQLFCFTGNNLCLQNRNRPFPGPVLPPGGPTQPKRQNNDLVRKQLL